MTYSKTLHIWSPYYGTVGLTEWTILLVL